MKKQNKIALLILALGLAVMLPGFISQKSFRILQANLNTDSTTVSAKTSSADAAPKPMSQITSLLKLAEQDKTWHKVQPIQQQGSSEVSVPSLTSNNNQGAVAEDIASFEPVDCHFDKPKKSEFSAKFISISNEKTADPDQKIQVRVLIENTGNVPWFSASSGCTDVPVISLGTARERDHESLFYPGNNPALGWSSTNRIAMKTLRVNPQEIASFTFKVKTPSEAGYYRDFFAPMVEGVTWMEKGALFFFDINVGNVELTDKQKQYFPSIEQSGNLANLTFEGEKKIEISLKKQQMQLKIGDQTIRTFPVSTGKPSTPTPRGKFKISLKQEVRVGGESPHYIMEKFQMIYARWGVGIHSLPKLANDRGVFWKEALNHIGSPRSHGCIRLLPDDAEFAFNFTDIGTQVEVKL